MTNRAQINNTKHSDNKVPGVLTLEAISAFCADYTYYMYKKPPTPLDNSPRL